jgi:secondary thiamine-phosphate synthase enzyme
VCRAIAGEPVIMARLRQLWLSLQDHVTAQPMQQAIETISLPTRGQGLYEFTPAVRKFIADSEISTGLLTVYVRHTSCSLLIQENADHDVQTDLLGFFGRLVPEGMEWLVHTTEGPDDMPAHIKAALTQTSIGIPVQQGEPVFGTWQGIYLFEHRNQPHRREVVLHIIGDR